MSTEPREQRDVSPCTTSAHRQTPGKNTRYVPSPTPPKNHHRNTPSCAFARSSIVGCDTLVPALEVQVLTATYVVLETIEFVCSAEEGTRKTGNIYDAYEHLYRSGQSNIHS